MNTVLLITTVAQAFVTGVLVGLYVAQRDELRFYEELEAERRDQ